jgi:drug/metabolite transporter (DMT)-like permease
MNPTAIALVVAAAVAHAGWNLCAKRVPNGGALFVWLYSTASAVIFVPVAIASVLILGQRPHPVWLLAIGLSGLLHVTYFVLLQRGYAVGDLSVVYPLARGTGPMFAVLAAVLLLGERPGLVPLLGAAVVVAGIAVIGGIGHTTWSWCSWSARCSPSPWCSPRWP